MTRTASSDFRDTSPDAPATARAPALVLDDATLAARARDGDLVAFEALVRRYERGIYQLALRMTGNGADAEDITQDTFVAAWRCLPEIQQEAAFTGWLYRTATNRCLNLLRGRRPTAPLDEQAAGGGPAHDPERAAQSSAALVALGAALARLTPRQRAAWLLREIHGRSYDEIAHTLETTPQAVRGRLARARAELAELMAPWQ